MIKIQLQMLMTPRYSALHMPRSIRYRCQSTHRPVAAAVDAVNFNDSKLCFQSKSISELLRSYVVFQLCRSRMLVQNAEYLVDTSYKYLGSTVTDTVLRGTFFGHFCAGQNTADMMPAITRLADAGIGSILDYAAEADVPQRSEEGHQTSSHDDKLLTASDATRSSGITYDPVEEELCDRRSKIFEACITSAHELQASSDRMSYPGFAAIKCTALGSPRLLERMSTAIVEIRNLFVKFDSHRTGVISQEEFREQYKLYFSGGMDVDEVFRMMDTARDGRIDYMEWSNTLTLEELHQLTAYCIHKGPLSRAVLTDEERQLLLVMRGRINALVALADKLDVRVMIDAEHSYFQPAIDNIAAELMRKHNHSRALVFTTYQMYLWDSLQRLRDDQLRAKSGNYYFAAKLVRGAYMELERRRADELHYVSPIHRSIEETHESYNTGVAQLIASIAAGERVEMMIASHNQTSIELALSAASASGLKPPPHDEDAPIYFGQLLGMADHLTYSLGGAGYKAYKYVPYGKIREVMPYLIRRAQENSDILMSGVGLELRMLTRELTRRLLSRG